MPRPKTILQVDLRRRCRTIRPSRPSGVAPAAFIFSSAASSRRFNRASRPKGPRITPSRAPFSALANILLRDEKQELALRMSAEIGRLLDPPPEGLKILGPAEAPVPRLKNEYRYQFLVKAASRKVLNELLQRIRAFALEHKWGATALVIDVDPLSLM